jgi:Spy/CpxP family protein refolding chaperone
LKKIVNFITSGVLFAGLALAQRPAPDPAAMVQRQVEHLTQRLTLTPAQQAQANTIFTNAQTANQAVMTQLRQSRTSLSTAIKSNDTASIATVATQIGTLEGQMLANNSKAEAAFYAILTPDQQSKYTPGAGFGGFGGRMGPGGPGGPRGRGGDR